jgi:hypothetical protein
VTPEPARRRAGGLLAIAAVAALVVAGALLALLLSRGGGGGAGHEAGPGAGVLPTAPATVLSAARSTRTAPARAVAPGTWPVGATSFTVVLATLAKRDHPRAAAERLARSLVLPGLTAHVLDSSLHRRLRPSVWIVYAGRYSTRGPAERLARQIHAAGTRRGIVERLTG